METHFVGIDAALTGVGLHYEDIFEMITALLRG